MRKKTLFLAVGLTLVAGQLAVFTPQTKALSCVQTFPVVGVVGEITPENDSYLITLERASAFTASSEPLKEGISVNINTYVKKVNEYIQAGHTLGGGNEGNTGPRGNTVSIPKKAFAATSVKAGDIIINGPPFHVCSFRFFGIFSSDGELKSAVVNDDYGDYFYGGANMKVSSGESIACEGNYCSAKVNFEADRENFTLTPGNSFRPKADPFKEIVLIDSSDYKKEGAVFDWGFGRYVTYVIEFGEPKKNTTTPTTTKADQVCEPASPPKLERGCEAIPVYDVGNSCVNEYVVECADVSPEPSIFQRVWKWLLSVLGIS